MEDVDFSVPGIVKIIKSLNSYKASGPDDVSVQFLKLCPNEIARFLKIIFQKCVSSADIPNDWRQARIHHLVYQSPVTGLRVSPLGDM